MKQNILKQPASFLGTVSCESVCQQQPPPPVHVQCRSSHVVGVWYERSKHPYCGLSVHEVRSVSVFVHHKHALSFCVQLVHHLVLSCNKTLTYSHTVNQNKTYNCCLPTNCTIYSASVHNFPAISPSGPRNWHCILADRYEQRTWCSISPTTCAKAHTSTWSCYHSNAYAICLAALAFLASHVPHRRTEPVAPCLVIVEN